MKEKLFLFLLSIFGISSIYSCGILPHPDTFKLNISSSAPMEGFILSDISLVEKTFDNEILIHRNGACSIKGPDLTTNHFEFTVTLHDGEGFKLMTRTDRKKYKAEPGIVLEWTKDGSVIYENGKELARNDSVKAVLNFPVKMTFINEGEYFQFTADCDTIFKGRTSLPESEYYIIESLDSELKISGISMEQLYGYDREQILEITDENTKTNEETIIIK